MTWQHFTNIIACVLASHETFRVGRFQFLEWCFQFPGLFPEWFLSLNWFKGKLRLETPMSNGKKHGKTGVSGEKIFPKKLIQ